MMKSIQTIVCVLSLWTAASFDIGPRPLHTIARTRRWQTETQLRADGGGGSSYESSASLTKGIVSSLTSLANSVFGDASSASPPTQTPDSSSTIPPDAAAPSSPRELLGRIRDDYTKNNYLWTGKLDTSAFASDCTFTDPTLSFVGVDKYVENVGNLVPVVNYLLGEDQSSRSELLDISLNEKEKYVETRWNMVGELNRLPWRPRIDVIGRTKFWYQEEPRSSNVQRGLWLGKEVRVYLYDESWEIPAGRALLQIVTRRGTIPNTSEGGL